MQRTDQELLAAVAGGDRGAFAEYYDRHAPRVFALLQKWLGRSGAADDVLQETFWQVWRTAGRYDSLRAVPEAWLILIARSRATDHLRGRRPEVPLAAQDQPAVAADPSSALDRDEAAQRVRGALEQLSTEQREAIILTFFDGLTHDQIAQCQRIPLGTAKTRIRLAMERLRQLLLE
jgi:RNA polymerase sigma-70 factor (ECF subfamily)